MATKERPIDTQFTVFIRLPFPRGEFQDPPPVEWTASKDQALWEILSRPSKGDIDWKALAENFQVTLQFLLQQAAWLYDRQLSQVRAQIRKVGTTQSNSPSPVPGSVSGSTALGGQPSRETIVPGSRAPSRQQKDALQRDSDNRRTSAASASFAAQSRGSQVPPKAEMPTADSDSRWDSFDRRPLATRQEQLAVASSQQSPPSEEEPLSSSLSEESASDDDEDTSRPPFKRFGQLSIHPPGLQDDEYDDDDTPAFLPLARESEPYHRERPNQELGDTLRINAERAAAQRRRDPDPLGRRPAVTSESSASSMSSFGPFNQSPGRTGRRAPVSGPQRTLEPRQNSRRSNTSGREASDGTPSMGSSFSDLDDASVTQSALEEALMSNMQHGGIASRMSTISQALRSRYLH